MEKSTSTNPTSVRTAKTSGTFGAQLLTVWPAPLMDAKNEKIAAIGMVQVKPGTYAPPSGLTVQAVVEQGTQDKGAQNRKAGTKCVQRTRFVDRRIAKLFERGDIVLVDPGYDKELLDQWTKTGRPGYKNLGQPHQPKIPAELKEHVEAANAQSARSLKV